LLKFDGKVKYPFLKIEQKSAYQPKPEKSPSTGALTYISLYLLVLITPLVLVTVFRPQTDHSFIYELGKNFALLGLTILAIQFVLAARLKWIEEPFGLDIVIQFHRFMGIFATILLLVHPILLALGEKGWFFLISLDSPWFIWVARIVFLILLIHTIFSRFRGALRIEFQKWLRWHDILALLVIPLGFLHSWYAGGDLTVVQIQVLWVSLLILTFFIYIYHRVLRPKQLRRHPYRVIKVLKESHNVWTIKLAQHEGEDRFEYLPGQFHFITLYRGENLPVEDHPFTIASSPTQAGFISSTIKQSGDFTATIAHTKPGDIAVVHGPFGRFSYVLHQAERNLIFVTGGVGITPLMSMLRHMRDTRADIQVVVFYANRTRKDIIFHDELTEIAGGELPHLNVIHILSRPDENWDGETGYLSSEKIRHLCGEDLQNRTFYLCGPPMMIRQIIWELRDLGVPEAHIHFEKFSF
jgi:predicted ferric reductase